MFIAVGFELGFSVIAGILLGQYVDKWVGVKTPWFTILGLVAGCSPVSHFCLGC